MADNDLLKALRRKTSTFKKVTVHGGDSGGTSRPSPRGGGGLRASNSARGLQRGAAGGAGSTRHSNTVRTQAAAWEGGDIPNGPRMRQRRASMPSESSSFGVGGDELVTYYVEQVGQAAAMLETAPYDVNTSPLATLSSVKAKLLLVKESWIKAFVEGGALQRVADIFRAVQQYGRCGFPRKILLLALLPTPLPSEARKYVDG